MKKLISFFAAVVIVAALSSYLTLNWADQSSALLQTESAHQWLHEKLQITKSQHAALEPIESRFAQQQERYTTALHQANQHLATLIGEDKEFTPRVAAAVEQVHHCMGDLQKLSIEHLLEMRTVLTHAQGDQLLTLAQQALEQVP